MYIDENQIQSAYGKKNIHNYLDRNNIELVYKKSTALNEGVQYSNIGNALSANSISQDDPEVKPRFSLSVSRSYADIEGDLRNLNLREFDLLDRKRKAENNPEFLQAASNVDFVCACVVA